MGSRKSHPERCDEFIQKYSSDIYGGTPVTTLIYQVASVHGGTDPHFGKDTFRAIEADNDSPKLHLLASLLRLGDELAENADRVQEAVLERHNSSGESILANQYARSFAMFKLRKETLKIVYNVRPSQIKTVGTHNGKDCTFLDYIEIKIDTLEREARYCSQYGRPHFIVSQIDFVINEFEDEKSSKIKHSPKKFSLNFNRGYPDKLHSALCQRSEQLKALNIETLKELFGSHQKKTDRREDSSNSLAPLAARSSGVIRDEPPFLNENLNMLAFIFPNPLTTHAAIVFGILIVCELVAARVV